MSSTFSDDVPREFDNIEILFNLEGNPIWWPATVICSRERHGPGVVKGTATVEYVPMHNYKRSVESVYFMRNRMVNISTGDTPWRTSAEAADAGAGDKTEADWQHSTQTRRQSLSKELEKEGEVGCEDDIDVTKGKRRVSSDQCDGDSDDGDSVCAPSSRKKRRAPTDGGATVTVTPCASAQQNCSSWTQARPGGEGNHDSNVLQMLMKRVAVLELHKDDEVPRAIKNITRLFVSDIKTMWRARVLHLIRSPIRKNKPTKKQLFGASVTGGSLRFTVQFAYRWFANLVDDISECLSTRAPNKITYVPSVAELVAPPGDIAEGHVLFSSFRLFLQWIGITLQSDFRREVQTWRKMKNGTEAVRFIGGLQWTDGEDEKPLRMFIGNSCVQNSITGFENKGSDVEQVEFATSKWDVSNNMLASAPSRKRACRGEWKKDENSSNNVRISWRWTGGFEGKSVSCHGRRTGETVVGEVEVNLPTITVMGNALCAELRSIVTDDFLDSI